MARAIRGSLYAWFSIVLLALSACSADSKVTGASGQAVGTTGAGGGVSGATGSVATGGSQQSSGSGTAGASGGGDDAGTVSGSSGDSSGTSTEAGVTGSSGTGNPPRDSGLPAPDGGVQLGDGGVGWDSVPTILSRIVPPSFPNLDCDVTKYGGVGDGNASNTAANTSAFAKAIADCSARGGGRVVVPMGTFATGPIELVSKINLFVSAGATIKFSTDPALYLPIVKVSWEGSLVYNYHPLIWAHDATDVAITGTGTIDGNATNNDWYPWKTLELNDQLALRQQNVDGVSPELRKYGAGHYLRPGLIEFMNCTNVLFDGFTAQNSPFWTIHPVLSRNVTARNFRAVATPVNTDGFDPESCTDVLVDNAVVQVGDDAIAVKAGRGRDGFTYYRPSQNIVIQNSTSYSHVGGVTIGSEMSAGVQNVYIQDMKFPSTAASKLQYGLFIKAAVQRGGYIRDIYVRRLTVATVINFLMLTGHYVAGAVVGPTNFTTFDNINIDAVTVARTTAEPFIIAGSDATKVATGIHLSNIAIAASATPALSTMSGHYSGLTTTNVVVNGAPFNPPASAP